MIPRICGCLLLSHVCRKLAFKQTMSSHNLRNVSSSMVSVLGDLCHEEAAASMGVYACVGVSSHSISRVYVTLLG